LRINFQAEGVIKIAGFGGVVGDAHLHQGVPLSAGIPSG
jgi:hypothetical protein